MEQSQDFTKKMTVALRDDLASWQLTNTVGHITAYLGNKMVENFDTGKYFVSEDGLEYPRNSQYAIVALKASKDELNNLVFELRGTDLLWIAYVQEMIDLLDDEELSRVLKEKKSAEMDILGVGVFGPKDELKKLTGKMGLWK